MQKFKDEHKELMDDKNDRIQELRDEINLLLKDIGDLTEPVECSSIGRFRLKKDHQTLKDTVKELQDIANAPPAKFFVCLFFQHVKLLSLALTARK